MLIINDKKISSFDKSKNKFFNINLSDFSTVYHYQNKIFLNLK